MNQAWLINIKNSKDRFVEYWKSLSAQKKIFIVSAILLLNVALSVVTYVSTRTEYVPLYANELSQREIGDIKAALDSRGFSQYQLSETGTSILVPKKDAPDLIVQLASEGLPNNGRISYELFSQNMTFGATDRQLDVVEQAAMQTELAEMIKRISGIKHAEVTISLPKDSVFIRADEAEQATASVMVEVEPGQRLSQSQIKALYYLISRSVPNLPLENIVIIDQYSEMLVLREQQEDEFQLEVYERQRKIKREIEQDIQTDLQQMLGTIMGHDKVLVHTLVTLNFDQVKTQENRVEAADEEDNEGIAVSAERLSRTFRGEGAVPNPIGVGETDVPGYTNIQANGESEYEELQDRVNYEVNRISTEITQSPYKIEKITVNVGVEPPDPDNPASLTFETQQNITNILENVVRTALGDRQGITDEDIRNSISVFPRVFAGKEQTVGEPTQNEMPWLTYVAIAAGVIIALLGGMVWLRRRREKQADEEPLLDEFIFEQGIAPEQMATDEETIQKQLDEMANRHPDEFVQMLRTWISEERKG
ncbi:flagellar M-ring protein FliF [Ammoniphilus oxalaticus]|uniref:Flagellar M-ring protein n=1 Tax=Ammoniphilus oxalaticus TaxID=66863 RepID=A0A419SJN7_9BACL|nr:flagellar basal-body MS-ring/collar protein FliF [Ammoniphilus oxalaticus]RKD24197.1 flagellar M-ring protein FliF [Ammoniphilus oxalaticus]